MDWTKAKTIIMAALMLTILFLLLTYGIQRIEPDAEDPSLQEETLKLLERQNIFFDGVLPEECGGMAVLNVAYSDTDEALLADRVDRQKGLPDGQRDRDDILRYALKFLEGCDFNTRNMKLLEASEQSGVYTLKYGAEIKGYSLEESYINCVVQDGKVTSVERFWMEPVDFGDTKRSTLSPTAALVTFMMQRDRSEEVHISHMEMVYWLESAPLGEGTPLSDTAFPAWKIVYNGGQISHINAYKSE